MQPGCKVILLIIIIQPFHFNFMLDVGQAEQCMQFVQCVSNRRRALNISCMLLTTMNECAK
jgi:hypothetical protein